MSAEDPSALRSRASPSSQRNGREDRQGPGAGPDGSEEARGPARQSHPQHLSTGPASRAARRPSIPYIDCSEMDCEYEGRGCRHINTYEDQAMQRRGSDTGSINGGFQPQQEHFLSRIRYRESPSPQKTTINISCELYKPTANQYYHGHQGSLHSTLIEDSKVHGAKWHGSSPLTVPHMVASKSATSSPVMSSLQQTGYLSHAEQNGHGSAPPYLEDRSQGFNARGPGPRGEEGLPHYGSYSPIPCHSPHLQKHHKMRNRADTDPYVVGQVPSTPAHEPRPVLSRAERIAALERRMVANGLSLPGQQGASPRQKHLGHGGAEHVGVVQLHDSSSTSGSESSEGEMETARDSPSGHQLAYSNSMQANSSPYMPRSEYSFDSLHLDEEDAEEDGCQVFSDEDVGQVFSC